jgi:hypothetical protein
MNSYDRLLIDPTQEQLGNAVRESVTALRRDLRGEPGWPEVRFEAGDVGEMQSLWTEIHRLAEGYREWQARARGWRFSTQASQLVVWWSDYLGRRHVRVVGGCVHRGAQLSAPGPNRPPLACIYPEPCILITRHRRSQLLVVCGCGVWGTPEQIAWMGPCCGPCFDRLENEPAPSLSWHWFGSAVVAICFAPDGERLAGKDHQGQFQIRALPDGKLEQAGLTLGGRGKLAFTDEGETLVFGTPDGRRTEIRQAERSRVLDAYPFALSAQGPEIFLHDVDDHIQLVDIRTGEILRIYAGHPEIRLDDLAVSPDGRLLVGASAGGLRFLDVVTGQSRGHIRLGACCEPIAFSPDSATLAVRIRTIRTYVVLYDLARQRIRAGLATSNDIHDYAFSPDGSIVVTIEDDSLRVWDTRTGLERSRLSPGKEQEALRTVAFAPSGRLLSLGTSHGTVYLWPAEILYSE